MGDIYIITEALTVQREDETIAQKKINVQVTYITK